MKNWHSLLALFAVACSSSGTWREVETPHFTLKTDLSASDAKRAAVALEGTRDALVSAAWPSFKFRDEKTEVYVLASGLEFEQYFGKYTGGIFLHTSPPRFFMYGTPSHWELRKSAHLPTPSVLRHEMAHELSSEVWPRQPRWFSEGLANFLEAVYYSEDEQAVVLGGVNYSAFKQYRSVRTLGVEDAFAWNAGLGRMSEREAYGLYGLSWLIVHWLYNVHPNELGKYLNVLHDGKATPEEALKIAMPDLDPATVNREIHEYQKHGKFEEFSRPVVATPIEEDKLPDRLLSKDEVADIKQGLTNVSQQHRGKPRDPETNGSGHFEETANESSAAPEPKRASSPPVKRPPIDYEALPILPQYPCPKEGEASADDAKPLGKSAESVGSKSGKKPVGKKSEGQTPKEVVGTGRLAPEEIQRIIRASYGQFRKCYEEGLGRDANLGGRVVVRFVIERSGAVSNPRPACISMPDPKVVGCVVEGFKKLHFPAPDGGIVTVTYPMMLSPGDD